MDSYMLSSQKINSDTNIALSNINAKASVERSRISADRFKAGVDAQASMGAKNTDAIVSTFIGGLSASNMRNAVDNQLLSTMSGQMLTAGIASKNIDADVRKYEMGSHVQLQGISADLQKSLMGRDIAVLNNNLANMIASNEYDLGKRKIDVVRESNERGSKLDEAALVTKSRENEGKLRLAEMGLNLGHQVSMHDMSNTLYGLTTERIGQEMTNTNLPTILAAQQAMAQSRNETQVRLTKLNTEAARKNADTNIFKTLVGGITSIFGF